MAGKKRKDVRDEDVTGLKYFDKLAPLLARLHDVGCQRDKAGNRKLHFDQHCLLLLLFFFNPVVRSLRAIQQASQLRKVQRKLGCLRASLGSLSEAQQVFDPERLKEIIAELGAQLQPIARVQKGVQKGSGVILSKLGGWSVRITGPGPLRHPPRYLLGKKRAVLKQP